MVRNTADAGLEWAIYWIFEDNAAASASKALDFTNLKNTLLKDSTLAGVAKDINDTTAGTKYVPGGALHADMTLPSAPGVTAQGFTLGLTRMGAPTPTDMSVSTSPGGFNPAGPGQPTGWPQLWAVRSDAQVHQGSIIFVHAKEAWILNPIL
jgi:hypothetical protein